MKFLLLNQTFYPDVMATGQYLAEVAVRLVEHGHQVTVVTSSRAYDHPEKRFAKQEVWRGVRIVRVGSAGFGKGAKWRRAADFASFLALASVRLARLPRHDVVVALTSPPLISFLGAWLALFWRASFAYWVMDLNPDEAIAAGWLRADTFPARLLERMSRFSLRRATLIVALDRFMQQRVIAKGIPAEKIAVIPPWSHDDVVRFDAEGRERFRKQHGLEGKFVVMYSGNHSPCHPLETLLAAAGRLAADPGIVFCFVGGGSEWRKIAEKQKAESRKQKPDAGGQKAESRKQKVEIGGQRAEDGGRKIAEKQKAEIEKQKAESRKQKPDTGGRKAESRKQKSEDRGQKAAAGAASSDFNFQLSAFRFSNIQCLPYQPLDQLAGSLSAADLHVVVMGDAFVGLVHPCKIYNILSVGAPVLYIGPEPSHVTEILARAGEQQLWGAAANGEAQRVVTHIQRIRQAGVTRTGTEFGQLAAEFARDKLLSKLAALLES
jgi:glycosyltransferase involved in cell wall biosynthesis